MIAPVRSRWPDRLRRLRLATIVVALPALAAFAAGTATRGSGPAGTLLTAVALAIAASGIAYVIRLNRTLARCSAQNKAIFERAGISMWLEDWSAAGREIASLRLQGISDVEAYYATRPDALRALCAQVRIKDVNSFTVEEAGTSSKTPLLGSLDTLLPHTDQTFVQWLVALARGDRFFRSEAHVSRPDGTEIDTLFTAALPDDLEGFEDMIVTCLDITGYKSEQAKLLAADAQIARASRISTVGALSASIAHEVNSPLAAIVANAHAALRWLKRPSPDLEEVREAVSAIVTDATRAKDVVVRTRAFVGNAAPETAPFDVVAAAREANLLVERELRSCGAALHLHAEVGLPLAVGDVVQTQQVFTNLFLNAAQAMADQEEAKEITVSLARHACSLRVDVRDTGPGIDPDELERIFDPFYTSRPDGIGMGLAICRNCIDGQGGHIWATNEPDRGATMHFTLPMHDA